MMMKLNKSRQKKQKKTGNQIKQELKTVRIFVNKKLEN